MTWLLRPDVERAAAKHGLAADLVHALCLVESGGNPWAYNPEPRYRYLWDVRRRRPFRAMSAAEVAAKIPPADFPSLAGDRDQEWWGQQASWGLAQVMGAVAREHGFDGPYLTRLCDVTVGLHYGCLVLASRLRWARGDVRAALASYNGGAVGNAPGGPLRNETYVVKIEAALAQVRAA